MAFHREKYLPNREDPNIDLKRKRLENFNFWWEYRKDSALSSGKNLFDDGVLVNEDGSIHRGDVRIFRCNIQYVTVSCKLCTP